MKELLESLKSNGYKITEQRKSIIQVLTSYNNKFISVETLFNESKKIYSKTNMSTVYRNLEILENLNLIHKILTKEGISLYQLISTTTHHHHIICKRCGKTEVIDFCPISSFEKLSKNKNFTLTDHKFELYGYCFNCENLKDS
jgi:Fe2+ or Zn2+ uptake regulation protein